MYSTYSTFIRLQSSCASSLSKRMRCVKARRSFYAPEAGLAADRDYAANGGKYLT